MGQASQKQNQNGRTASILTNASDKLAEVFTCPYTLYSNLNFYDNSFPCKKF